MGLRWVISFLFLWSQVGQGRALRVSIDPGHGGRDRGAIYGKIRESDLNLKIAKKLYERLKRDSDFEVLLLRKTDRDLGLPTRLKMSRQFGSDLFISIHANAHKSRKVHGSEFYIQQPQTLKEMSLVSHSGKARGKAFREKNRKGVWNKGDKNRRGNVENIVFDLEQSGRLLESYQLGTFVRRHWRQNKKRRIRQAPFYVLSQNSASAVLIEVGYITNERERRKLTQTKVQRAIARKIHGALKDYAKNVDKLPWNILKTGDVKIR